jgi:hypothetical protein
MVKLNQIVKFIKLCTSRYPVEKTLASLQRYLLRYNNGSLNKNNTLNQLIIIQGSLDPLYFGMLSALSIDLRKLVEIDVCYIVLRSINSSIGFGWQQTLMRSRLMNWVIGCQLSRLYKPLFGDAKYFSKTIGFSTSDHEDRFKAKKLWMTLHGQEDISKCTFNGIVIGDLVIDTYLRYRPSPRFCLDDPFVLEIITQAIGDVRRLSHLFERLRPSMYLSSYSTYIEHGIAVRIALKYGVKVHVYGNINAVGKLLTLEDVYHTVDSRYYRRDFNARYDGDLGSAARMLAESGLEARLSGSIDMATSYMHESAYKKNDLDVPNVEGARIIFLHDFYDSPHIFPELIFQDFWSWLTFTIQTLEDAGLRYLVKPHPNQIQLSEFVTEGLTQKFPQLKLLSPQITNQQLVDGGIVCGITVYGTVAHELAFLGVPTVSCSRDPHNSFEFCKRARDINTYKEFLVSDPADFISKSEMRRQALEFYFMHNLAETSEFTELRAGFAKFKNVCGKESLNPDQVVQSLSDLRGSNGWECHVKRLLQEISCISIEK